MVSHTTNPTSIKPIDQSAIELLIDRNEKGEIDTLSVSRIDFSHLGIPNDSRITLIGKARYTEIGIDLGTIGRPTLISKASLASIDKRFPFNIRIIVSDPNSKKILASCEHISTYDVEQGELQSLLPVEPVDLGERLWLLSTPSGERPILQVSDDLSISMLLKIKNDPLVQSLVLPQAIEEALVHVIRSSEADEDPPEWAERWWRFLDRAGIERPELSDENEQPDYSEWISMAVFEIISKMRLKSKLIASLGEEG
jgi:hypothetical protein